MPLEHAQDLFATLRGKLPGYAIPEFIIDIPGGKGKVPAGKSWQVNGEFQSPLAAQLEVTRNLES